MKFVTKRMFAAGQVLLQRKPLLQTKIGCIKKRGLQDKLPRAPSVFLMPYPTATQAQRKYVALTIRPLARAQPLQFFGAHDHIHYNGKFHYDAPYTFLRTFL